MQTSVTNEPLVARAGMREYAHVGEIGHQVMSTSITRAAIAGRVVSYDATAGKPWDSGKSPAAAADLTALTARGVAILGDSDDPTADVSGLVVSVVRKGYIWVPTEELLAINTNPFVRHVAAGAEVLGSWRTDADGGGPDATQVTWAKVVRVESASLALLKIDL